MKKQPILAICYDFDKTLSPEDMQAQGYIQSIEYEVADFWKESNKLASDNDMDQNLAYMYMMRDKSRGKVLFTKETLRQDGGKVRLFPGVSTWFDRINEYGKSKGVIVEHYIISSGLKEMIEGTEVAKEFKKIYASSFYYNDAGEAVWPAQVVNYTNKTQLLFISVLSCIFLSSASSIPAIFSCFSYVKSGTSYFIMAALSPRGIFVPFEVDIE